jgi:hypothetical protein
VRARITPAGTNFPLTSTSGGFPGEKNKSLIFGEVLSITASKAEVVFGATAGLVAVGIGWAEGAIFGALVAGEDIRRLHPLDKNSDGANDRTLRV